MIINLSAQRDKNQDLVWKTPVLYFDQRLNYTVCVHFVHTELLRSELERIENNELLHLTTNLIDQSSLNESSSIVFMNYNSSKGQRQTWRFRNPIYIPLQLFELENTSFSLRHFFQENQIRVNKIFIQIEILKEQPHARILKVH